jgi:hypothetical protein
LKPNFELGPNRSRHDSIDGLLVRHPHGDTGVTKRDQLDLLLSQGKIDSNAVMIGPPGGYRICTGQRPPGSRCGMGVCRAGFDGYLTKPIKVSELMKTIEETLDNVVNPI